MTFGCCSVSPSCHAGANAAVIEAVVEKLFKYLNDCAAKTLFRKRKPLLLKDSGFNANYQAKRYKTV
jgi:hypothetical protein